jgi:hypothetical protein
LCIHINKSLNVGKRFCTPYIFIGGDAAYIGSVFSFIQIVLKDILEHAVSYGSAFRHTLAGILKPFLTIFFTQGQYTLKAVEKVLASPKYVSHAYRSCEGILSLRKKYGKERLENACKRVSESGTVTYSMLKNILQNNLDKAENRSNVCCIPTNEYVRGAEAFSNI